MLRELLNLPKFLSSTARPYLARYGWLRGLRFAMQVRHVEYVASPGKTIAVAVPGLRAPIWLRAGMTDAAVLSQYFVQRPFDISCREEPRFIIDAGAYTGISSIYLATTYPTAQIIALELESSNFALLTKNTATYPNIIALHKGLWHCRGRLAVANPAAAKWSFRATEAAGSAEDTTEGIGVCDLLEEYNHKQVDLLKMDIEGAEKDVLTNGSAAWIESVLHLVIELHDRFRPGCTESLQAAIKDYNFRESVQSEYHVLSRNDVSECAPLWASPQ